VQMGYLSGKYAMTCGQFKLLEGERAKDGKYGEYVKQDRRQELHPIYTEKKLPGTGNNRFLKNITVITGCDWGWAEWIIRSRGLSELKTRLR
jgi:hypothetical protein